MLKDTYARARADGKGWDGHGKAATALYEQLPKIKRSMAEERDIGIGDESVSYIANQILEAFMHSRFVDEGLRRRW